MTRLTEETRTLARLICEAVGLNVNKVSRLELVLDANDVPRLRAEMMAFDVQPALGEAVKYLGANLIAGNVPFEVVIVPKGGAGWNIGHTNATDAIFDALDEGTPEDNA